MTKGMSEAIKTLEELAIQLDQWADEISSDGGSTRHSEPMRNRAAYLRNSVKTLKTEVPGS